MASRLVARAGDEPEYRDTLAFVQIQLRDLASALAQYEKCQLLQPGNPRWGMRIVEVLLEQRKVSEARKRFEAFGKRYPVKRMSPEEAKVWGALKLKVAPEDGAPK